MKDYVQTISVMIESSPFGFFSLLRKERNKDLMQFVINQTSFLDTTTLSDNIGCRAYCAIHGYSSFPLCEECGCSLNETYWVNSQKGFRHYCIKHTRANHQHNEKFAMTLLSKLPQDIIKLLPSLPVKDIVETFISSDVPTNKISYVFDNCSQLSSVKSDILCKTKYIDCTHMFSQRIFNVMNDMSSYPVCKHCKCELSSPDNFKGLLDGYFDYCSVSCMSNDDEVKCKKIDTSVQHFGYDHWMHNPEKVQQFEQQNLSSIDVKWPWHTEQAKAKRNAIMLERYETTHPLQNDQICEKFKMTVANFSEEQKQHRIAAQKQHFLISIGAEHPHQTKDGMDKFRATMQRKYGVDYPYQVQDFLKKSQATCMKNNGVIHPLQNNDILRRQQANSTSSYHYDGICFDSSIELAYYIFLKEVRDVRFEYHTKSLKYICEGVEHIYFPDFFIIDTNTHIELKGSQFFDVKGNFIDPYHKDAKLTEAKYNCMMSNNVVILKDTDDEVVEAMKYCAKKFNLAKWHKRFKVKDNKST